MQSIAVQTAKFIFLDLLGDAFYFPFWWYTRGIGRRALATIRRIRTHEANLGVILWARHIFVPMFGQRDAAGKLISLVMRFVQIIGRGVIFLLLALGEGILFFLWIILPVFIVWQILYHLGGYVYLSFI